MHLSFKRLLMEIIVEASIGKKFPIILTKNGIETKLIGIASVNTKPGERPYRITWFTLNLSDNRHVDLSLEEMTAILNSKSFPPDIIQRIRDRYPDSNLIADKYTIIFQSSSPAEPSSST